MRTVLNSESSIFLAEGPPWSEVLLPLVIPVSLSHVLITLVPCGDRWSFVRSERGRRDVIPSFPGHQTC